MGSIRSKIKKLARKTPGLREVLLVDQLNFKVKMLEKSFHVYDSRFDKIYKSIIEEKQTGEAPSSANNVRLTEVEQKILTAARENRAITVDYPIRIRKRPYENTTGGKLISELFEHSSQNYTDFIRSILDFRSELLSIRNEPITDTEPFWLNGWIGVLDGISIYTLIRTRKPKTYFEVGSGNSTKFARKAIQDGQLSTQVVSIDPAPRANIDKLCDQVIRSPLEDLGDDFWSQSIKEGDVLFVDNSHRSFQSSDVTVFFTEVLPQLPPDVTWGLHDIFLPEDYPENWSDRFYNEQYLMASYLLGGAVNDHIIFPSFHVSTRTPIYKEIEGLFSETPLAYFEKYGSSIWLRRRAK